MDRIINNITFKIVVCKLGNTVVAIDGLDFYSRPVGWAWTRAISIYIYMYVFESALTDDFLYGVI